MIIKLISDAVYDVVFNWCKNILLLYNLFNEGNQPLEKIINVKFLNLSSDMAYLLCFNIL